MVDKKFGFGAGSGGFILKNTYPHPYSKEIEEFRKSIVKLVIKNKPEERLFYDMNQCKCTWVDTVDGLLEIKKKLEKKSEFALDLEGHSFRSFQGFVCLMQISTRDEDFLIDCQQIREHIHLLLPCFLNPKITKVIHGSENDILWLQRDFGIYVVNLFDTGQAARVLNYPSFSFAYLLNYHCNKIADKKYQSADWRVRPLPSEMVKYAREDTHYLLYIYDRMRNILLENSGESNLYKTVLMRSIDICLSRYEKVILTDTSYISLFNKLNGKELLDKKSENVFRGLYHWRDRVARKEDESYTFVLPNHMLLMISQKIPTSKVDLFNLCTPVPPLLRKDYKAVLNVISNSCKGIFEEVNPKFKASVSEPSIISTENDSMNDSFDMSVENGKSKTPVLSTEELYSTVGWIENENKQVESDDMDVDSNQKDLFNHSNEVDIKQSFVSSLFEFDSKPQYPEVNKIKSSFSFDSMFGDTPLKQKPSQVDEKLDLNLAKFVEQPSTPVKKNIINNIKEKIKETPPEERVPKSLGEIYKLSQENRKKNKKKKSKTETSAPKKKIEPEEDFKKPVNTPPEKPVDFMRKIGWIQSGAAQKLELEEEEEEKDEAHNDTNSDIKIKKKKKDFNPYNTLSVPYFGKTKKPVKKSKKTYSTTYPGNKSGKAKWTYKKN